MHAGEVPTDPREVVGQIIDDANRRWGCGDDCRRVRDPADRTSASPFDHLGDTPRVQACAFAESRTVDFPASPVQVVPDLGGTSCTRETVVMSVAGNRARPTTAQRPLNGLTQHVGDHTRQSADPQ